MGHRCCSKQKIKRGLWSPEEDDKLVRFITTHGHKSWSSVPKLAGLQRCGKSCRLRWINYLRPDLKRGSFTSEEEQTIIEVHRILGNRWAQIAKHLPGRTDNEVKNFWNSSIKKKLISRGFDPQTHNLLSTSHNNKTPYYPSSIQLPTPQFQFQQPSSTSTNNIHLLYSNNHNPSSSSSTIINSNYPCLSHHNDAQTIMEGVVEQPLEEQYKTCETRGIDQLTQEEPNYNNLDFGLLETLLNTTTHEYMPFDDLASLDQLACNF